MKRFIRDWLGINDDVINISQDMQMLDLRTQQQALNAFEIFHTLPFAAIAVTLTAQEAAALTQPHGIQANSLPAILTGVILQARQGNSQLEVSGEVDQKTRDALMERGFKVEDQEGSAGKFTYVLWT